MENEKIQQVTEELEQEFLKAVSDGKKLLAEKGEIVQPILHQWAKGKIYVASGTPAEKELGIELIKASQNTLEDHYAALTTAGANLILQRVMHGLHVVFQRVILPSIFKAALGAVA